MLLKVIYWRMLNLQMMTGRNTFNFIKQVKNLTDM